jgi:hypothetical protein
MKASDIYTKSWLTDDIQYKRGCTRTGEGTSADGGLLILDEADYGWYLGP